MKMRQKRYTAAAIPPYDKSPKTAGREKPVSPRGNSDARTENSPLIQSAPPEKRDSEKSLRAAAAKATASAYMKSEELRDKLPQIRTGPFFDISTHSSVPFFGRMTRK